MCPALVLSSTIRARRNSIVRQLLNDKLSLPAILRSQLGLSIRLPLPSNMPLLVDPTRHILHNIVQLSVDSLLHLLLRKTDRNFTQSALHLRPGILDILLGRHPGQSFTDLLFDYAFEVFSGQLVCLRLSYYLLQGAHIEGTR